MKYIKGILLLVAILLVIFWPREKNKIQNNIPPTPTTNLEQKNLPNFVKIPVPFTAQAPTGNWADVKQGNGCEEASILMAYSWIVDRKIEKEMARNEILKMSDFSFKSLGHFHDISNEDTIKLFKEYFKYENVFLEKKVDIENIKKILAEEKVLIVAVNGDLLANPNYQIPKPANHKLVIIGYDEEKKEFITHDPGTSKGNGYRYSYDKLMEAITDYPTGYRESFEEIDKSIIIVEKVND